MFVCVVVVVIVLVVGVVVVVLRLGMLSGCTIVSIIRPVGSRYIASTTAATPNSKATGDHITHKNI
jgi:hypothetical protein